MALRGETIGTAYVRVLADGDGFSDSIREQIRDAEGGFRQLGRTHSEAYQEGFDEQNDNLTPGIIRGLEAGIRRNAGRFDAIGEQISNGLFDPLDRQFRSRFGDLVGKQMSKDIREAFFRSGGASDAIDDFVEHLESNWEKATRVVDRETKEVQRLLDAQAKRLVQIEDDRAKDVSSIRRQEFEAAINRINTLVAIEKEEEKRKKIAQQEQEKIERRTQVELRKTNAEFRSLVRTIETFHRSLDGTRGTRKELLGDLDRLGNRIRQLDGGTVDFERSFVRVRHELVRTQPILSRMTNTFDDLSLRFGRAFGRGSRSEFLNFFGRVVQFLTAVPGLVTKAVQGLINFGQSFRFAFSEGGVSGLLKQLSVTAIAATVSITALIVVFGIAAAVAGILSSAILSLVGALVAMTSSLAFAAGGGVAVLAASFAPLIAAIGVTILAVKNLPDATKEAFKEVGDAFEQLGKDAARNIFDSPAKDAAAFTKAVKDLAVIVDPVSKALGGLLDEFIEDLNSPLWVRFREDLGRVLPDMVTTLGHIFEDLTNALVGLFIAIAPSTQEFLDWIHEAVDSFSRFVNSGEGRQAIEDFMDRAKESAKAVGDAIGEIIGLIGDLLGVSKDTGDNLFTSLADTVERWRTSLKAAAEDGTLQRWFADASDTAKAIGDALVAFGKLIEALDTPENRKLVRDISSAFIELVGFIADAYAAFRLFGTIMRGVYNGIIGPVLAFLIGALATVLRFFGNLFRALSNVPGFGWAKKLGNDLLDAAAAADATADAVRNIPKEWNVAINVTAVASQIAKVEHQLDALAHTRNVYYAAVTGNPKAGAAGSPRLAMPSTDGGRYVNVEQMTVITPTEDPFAVASEVVNRLAAAAYV